MDIVVDSEDIYDLMKDRYGKLFISFSGSQSSGKSTLLEKCKLIYPSFNFVEEVTRPIKRKGLPINERGGSLTQSFIINAHLENWLQYKNSTVIMDRCILDGLVYTEYLYENDKVDKRVLEYTRFVYGELIQDIDFIWYTHPVSLVDDGTRSVNEEFRNRIIELFDKHLTEIDQYSKCKIIHLEGSVEERLLKIATVIPPVMLRCCNCSSQVNFTLTDNSGYFKCDNCGVDTTIHNCNSKLEGIMKWNKLKNYA